MAQITMTGRAFYAGGTSGASAVVGWESGRSRVCRHTLITDGAGASAVSLSFAGNSLAGVAQYPELRFYIGTDPDSHANAGPSSTYTGSLTRTVANDVATYTGSATMVLLPSTTYYVWVFPAATDYKWLYWSTASGTATATTSGAAKSTMTIAGTKALGSELTFNITRYSTAITHNISYSCGTASATPKTGVATSVKWTPPVSLSAQNTAGMSVVVIFTLHTVYNGEVIGTNDYPVKLAIPDSVRPALSIAVSDPTGYATTYGGYIQSRSKMQITVNGTPAHGSPIVAWYFTANGGTYTTASATTEVIAKSGTNTISASVTDQRGQIGEGTANVSVLAYTPPQITKLVAVRCNQDGSANTGGGFVKATFSWSVTSLSNKNGKTIQLRYKKNTATTWTTVNISSAYTGTNVTSTFAADTGSAYDVQVVVTDSFDSVPKSTVAPPARRHMNFRRGGGVGVGGRATGNWFDVWLDAKFHGTAEVGSPTEDNHATPKSYVLANCAPSGYGLGATSAPICINADTLLTGGFYTVSASKGTTNPANTEGSLLVISGTYTTQLLLDTPNGMRRRIYLGSGWSAWEWEHPPMVVGTEYQTTERWSNKPVYTKIIDCGTASNGKAVAHGLSGCTFIRYSGILNKAALPYITYSSFTGSDTAYLRVTASNIYIYIGSNASGTVFAQLWYTKT